MKVTKPAVRRLQRWAVDYERRTGGVVIEDRVRRQQGRVAFTAEVAALKAAGVPEFLGSCYSLLRVRSLVLRKGVCEAVQAFADGRPRLREVY